MAIFYHFAVLLFSLVEVRLVHAAKFRSLSLGQRYPDAAEIATCGNIRDIIRRNSARFRKILVRNANNEIDFSNDDCRRMTARAKSKIDVLASRVRSRWSNVRLRVILGWTDQIPVDTQKLLHYEGKLNKIAIYRFHILPNFAQFCRICIVGIDSPQKYLFQIGFER